MAPASGVADAKFLAYVAALACRAHGAFRVLGDVKSFLAPHTIDLLPVSAEVKSDLHRFSLHTMGAVAEMSAHVLTDRFGLDGRRAWSLCNGIDDSPVVPLALEESVVEHTSLPFHSSSIQTLFVALDAVLKRAYARPDMRGRYAGGADLLCTSSGWPPWETSVRFKQPVGAWERASVLVRNKVEADPPRNPVEDVTVILSGFTGESGTQLGLLKDVQEDRHRRLVEVERRLQAVMGGAHMLHRIAEVAPWHPAPEMRALQVPIDPSARDAITPLHTPKPVEVRQGMEGDPVSVRLKRRWRRVARIDDMWTFDLRWLPEPVARDYYRIEPDDGGQITLFRDEVDDRWYRQSG